MDAEGYIWNCRVVGGGCVVRFDPEGRVDRVVDLPCSWPTSCTFGGPDLKTLYVTSARFTMTDNHLLAHPFEGGLFAIKPGVVGLRANLFG
ncbi:MAG: SMP-30/gluconolactonase/LRE family protein, partial [Planktomarina sp.]|nr:SMP-30/gluconolactonase/LRE family protein [Planktomarina sp.]